MAATSKNSSHFEKIIFVYNSCDFDAFEVLGVSPSASIDEILAAYQAAKAKMAASSHPFIEAAFFAIRQVRF